MPDARNTGDGLHPVPHSPRAVAQQVLRPAAPAPDWSNATSSEHKVVYLGADDIAQRVTLSVPYELLEALQQAWRGGSNVEVITVVRDLFDGADGELQFLSRLGFRP